MTESGTRGTTKQALAAAQARSAALESELEAARARIATLEAQAAGPPAPAGADFSAILASIRDGFLVLDRDWRFVFANDRAAAVLGATPAELLGQNIWARFPQLVGSSIEAHFRLAMAGRTPVYFEYAGLTTARSYEISVYPAGDGISVFWLDCTERKRAEGSQRRYELLSEHAMDILLMVRLKDGRIIEANRAAIAAYGYRREELLALTITDLRFRDQPDSVGDQMRRAYAEGLRFEALHRRRDGTVFQVEVHSIGAEVDGERVLLSVVRDITERRQAEAERLRQAERMAWLASFPNLNPLPVLELAAGGVVRYRNPAAERLLAPAGAEEAWLAGVMDAWAEMSAGDREVSVRETRLGEAWYQQVFLRLSEQGALRVYAVDTTAIHRGAQALEALAAEKTAILDSIADGLIVYDLDGHIVQLNPTAETLLGYDDAAQAEDIKGRTEAMRPRAVDGSEYPPEDYPIRRALRGETVRGVDMHVELPARGELWTRIAAAPIRASDGTVLGCVATFSDISELRELAEALRETNAQLLAQAEALRGSQARLAAHIENSPLAVIEFEAGERIVRWSAGAERMFGWTADEVLGKCIGDFPWVHEDDVDRVAELAGAMAAGDQGRNVHANRNYRKDGAVVYCEWHNSALKDAAGRLVSVFSQVVDVTERRQAEQRIRVQASIIDAMNDAVIVADRSDHIVEWNRAAERLYGWPSQEALGHRPEDLLPSTQAERHVAGFRRLVEQGAVPLLDLTHRGKDGRRVMVESNAFPLRNAAGEIVAHVAINRDITERRQAEERIRVQASIVDGMNDAAISADLDFRITGWNRAAEQIYGWTAEEVRGRPVKDVLRSDISDEQRDAIYDGLRSGEPAVTELTQYRRDDEPIVTSGYAMPLRNAVGEITGYVLMYRDITDRRQAEDHIRRHNAVLAAINGIFAAGMGCRSEAELGAACLAAAEELTGSRFGFIGELNADGRLDPVALSGPGWAQSHIDALNAHLQLPGGFGVHGLYGRLLATGQGYYTNDPASHPEGRGRPAGHPVLEAFLGVPLKSGEQTIGMIGLANRPGGYGPDELEAAEALAPAVVQMLLRMRAEAALLERARELDEAHAAAENERRWLAAAMDALPVGLLLTDAQGGTLRANQRFEEVWGGPRPQLKSVAEYGVYRAWWTETGERLRPEEWASARAVQYGETVAGQLLEIERFDGAHAFVMNSAAPVLDGAGRVAGSIVAIQDITELHLAEAALRAAEARFSGMIRAIPSLTFESDADGNNTFCSEQWCAYTGMTVEESAGAGWARAIHPDDAEAVAERWARAMSSGTLFESRHRLRSADGAYRWFIGRALPAEVVDGRIRSWAGSLTDIDDLVRAEEAVRNSERLYRGIGESIDYGVWVCAPNGRNIYASESFLKLVGQTQQECSDFGWGNVLHPDDAERTIAAWQQCVATEGKWDIEHRFKGVDGAWHPILARGVPVRDETGQIMSWAGINLDISRIKETEAALRQARDELDLRNRIVDVFLTSAGDEMYGQVLALVREALDSRLGVFAYIDDDGAVVGASMDAAALDECQMENKSIRVPVAEWGESIWGRAIRERRSLVSDRPGRVPAGHVAIERVAVSPIMHAGSVIGYLNVANRPSAYTAADLARLESIAGYLAPHLKARRERDLEEARRRAAEEALRRLNATLEERIRQRTAELEAAQDRLIQSQKMEAVGVLAGGVAHDFNNLLTAIVGNLELGMLKAGDAGAVRGFMHQALDASERAAGLTRQLLLFSRRQPVRFARLDVNTAIERTAKMLGRLLGEDIAVELRLESGIWPVWGDAGLLDQILLNMAVNARDAMPEGGRLTIHTCRGMTEHAGEWVQIEVTDTGSGISPDVLPHIFEPFFTTKQPGKGTGLGLAATYGIVNQHQGWIDVESELGRGTTMTVVLPAFTGPGLPASDEAEAPAPGLARPGRGQSILLVEDERMVREFAAGLLKESGYAVHPVASAEEALAVVAGGERFELVLSDVVLPGRSGVELARTLLAAADPPAVLLVSGYTDEKLPAGAVSDEGWAYLQKPYGIRALLEAVEERLRARQAR